MAPFPVTFTDDDDDDDGGTVTAAVAAAAAAAAAFSAFSAAAAALALASSSAFFFRASSFSRYLASASFTSVVNRTTSNGFIYSHLLLRFCHIQLRQRTDICWSNLFIPTQTNTILLCT
jgi:hypothetical protein